MKTILLAIALAFGALVAAPSTAAPIGFNGAYDFATWTTGHTGGTNGGSASTDLSQQTLTLAEPDDYSSCGGSNGCAFTFSHTVAASGTLSFDYDFDYGVDPCCSGFNVYINGTYYTVAGGNYNDPSAGGYFQPPVIGTFSTAVNAGDLFTFEAFSQDSCCGAATTTITNFDAPDAVPEPAMLGLFGMGALGLGLARRRRA